jgi:hypothetical protein
MAMSPVVNSYMQQGEPQEASQDASQIFVRRFSEQAFNTLRAKFPALVGNVVTLKTLASDVEKGTAFGVFIVESGNSLVYVPVAMSGGSIVSCEMVYDKDSDQFFPLNDHAVKEILGKSRSSDPVLLTGGQHVEDTRRLFHSMMRPPQSSNVVLAAERAGVAALPNACKAMVSRYLVEERPELLGKVASFYDIEALAGKLAQTPAQAGTAPAEYSLPAFLRLETLTKQAAAALSQAERKELLRSGYIVKSAENAPRLVAPEEMMSKLVEEELLLSSYPDGYDRERLAGRPKSCFEGGRCPVFPVGRGELISYDADGVKFTHVLLCGFACIAEDGRFRRVDTRQPVLVRNPTFEGISLSGFKTVLPISKVLSTISGFGRNSWVSMAVIVPMRNGTYSLIDCRSWINAPVDKWQVSDNTISVYGGHTFVTVNPELSCGYITDGPAQLVVPEGARFIVLDGYSDEGALPAVASFAVLQRALSSFGSRLTTSDNGAGISITDGRTQKTASFAGRSEAAGWLHENFGMTGEQIRTVLDNRHSLVFSKRAFLDPSPEVTVAEQAPYAAQQPVPDAPGMAGEIAQVPDFSALNDFAEVEDPEMFDVGVLSSFAEYPDIKAMLVEYLPDFLAAEDKIGRILLLFSSQKKEIEDFYGTEKCSTLMHSCRRIFTILGELVASLKLYVHMV